MKKEIRGHIGVSSALWMNEKKGEKGPMIKGWGDFLRLRSGLAQIKNVKVYIGYRLCGP